MADCRVDSEDRLLLHRRILERKPIIQHVFAEFYDLCVMTDTQYLRNDGLRVELGAGSSFFKDRYPAIIATDIHPAPHLDRVLDAQAMDLPNNSVGCFYGINCFHHFARPQSFFDELARTLLPGGGCILIEPYHGVAARAFYRHVHKIESFDPDQQGWDFTPTHAGVIANQALSYIVFVRDRALFLKRSPALEIVCSLPLANYPRYILSGGLNFRQLVPNRLEPAISACERMIGPARRFLALHQLILLRKRDRS